MGEVEGRLERARGEVAESEGEVGERRQRGGGGGDRRVGGVWGRQGRQGWGR